MAKKRAKPGRKPKPEPERRSKTIRFMATAGEKELIETAAGMERLELSAWMRSVLLKKAEEVVGE